MYRLVRLIFLYMTLISDSAAASEQPYNPAYIAIIIDDMGNIGAVASARSNYPPC